MLDNEHGLFCPFEADCESCPLGFSPVQCQGIEDIDED
jgi:hypothetical protein